MTRLCRFGFKTDELNGRSRGRATPCSTPPPPSSPPTPSRPWGASPPSPPPGLQTATQVQPFIAKKFQRRNNASFKPESYQKPAFFSPILKDIQTIMKP